MWGTGQNSCGWSIANHSENSSSGLTLQIHSEVLGGKSV